MFTNAAAVEELLTTAISVARRKGADVGAALDELPAPIYLTDAQGRLAYYNRACIAFAGRTPRVGQDMWCVTWRLFTNDGRRLPHAECPMAVAVRERRSVRGIEAVAERPDGTRVAFVPHPTPLIDNDGNLMGAVNLFLQVTGRKHAQALGVQAARCRRLARSVSDQTTTTLLVSMAKEYEQQASKIEQAS